MTSVNKVIIVGNLGRVTRDSLDAFGQRVFDGYIDALDRYISALDDRFAIRFAAAARRLADALRQLRELVGSSVTPNKITTLWMARLNRTAAFFHAAKVDARNLP